MDVKNLKLSVFKILNFQFQSLIGPANLNSTLDSVVGVDRVDGDNGVDRDDWEEDVDVNDLIRMEKK